MAGDNRTQIIVGALALFGVLTAALIGNWDKIAGNPKEKTAEKTGVIPQSNPSQSITGNNNIQQGGSNNTVYIPPKNSPERVLEIQKELDYVGREIAVNDTVLSQAQARLQILELQLSQFQESKREIMAEAQVKIIEEQRRLIVKVKELQDASIRRRVELERQL